MSDTIARDTPIGTRVKWGGGAAPVGFGRTASLVCADGTVSVEPDGGIVTDDNDIASLSYDTEHGDYTVMRDIRPRTLRNTEANHE